MPGFKLGNIEIKNGVCLAPMAGMTDAPLRLIARELGCEYAVTEMISACALTYNDKKTARLAYSPDGDRPLGIQLFGHDPEILSRAVPALMATVDYTPAAIDLNMGCPVHKIVGNGDGSAMMRDPEGVRAAVGALVRAADKFSLPVTVKIRAGWNAFEINAPEIARIAANEGAVAVFVHGRTREQMYAPSADREIIKRVRDALPPEVAVIGNGDIDSVDAALAMFGQCGCDGVMLGRAALGNPWLFRGIAERLAGRAEYIPTVADRVNTALRLLRDAAALHGEKRAVVESRTRAAYFIRELPGSAAVRGRLNAALSVGEVEEILSSLIR